jgi:Ca2+-binding EF-hand superfamily protein
MIKFTKNIVISLFITASISTTLPAQCIEFSIFDSNKDGSISKSEFDDARAKRMQQRAEEGRMMRNVGNNPDFTSFDTNKDGELSKEELQNAKSQMMKKRKANMGMGLGQRNMRRDVPTFESFDLNSDGYLTEEEMNKARASRMQIKASEGKMLRNAGNQTKFSDIDLNNDGKVSKDEFSYNQVRKNR